MREKESDTQNTICEYLERRQHFFWRVNNVGMYDPVNERYRSMPKYARYGVPDIILIIGGVFYGLEVKTKVGQQSVHQKKFQEDVEKVGGIYKVVRSVEDVQELGL